MVIGCTITSTIVIRWLPKCRHNINAERGPTGKSTVTPHRELNDNDRADR